MQSDFWHQRWATNQIGFHEPAANPLLIKHIDPLKLSRGNRIFIPLCGKTLDIGWLVEQGYRVVGAELSKLAIEQLFKELNVVHTISNDGKLERYSATNIDILVGNIFDVTPSMLGKVDAVYDRAALVALPREMRDLYSKHLIALTNAAPQLLICFEYDQNLVDGPPFSVTSDEVKAHYVDSYKLTLLEQVSTKLKGQFEAVEKVWLLDGLT